MKRFSLGVLVVGLVLLVGLNLADAQSDPPAGAMGRGITGRCGAMVGPGMMGGPMMLSRGGRMIGPGMMGGPVTGRCGCGMAGHHVWMKDEMGMRGKHHRLWRYMMNLDLDQKQKAEIWKIKADMMKNMIRKKADLKIARLELGELLHSEKTDMTKVEAKVKEMEGMKASMLISGIKAMEAAKSKLTAEQRKKLADMMEGPGPCIMRGDDTMSSTPDEGMMEEGTMGEGEMEEAPSGK